MSKRTLEKEIKKELQKLNDTIDRKIVRGVSFRDEARRHRNLLVTLQRMHEGEYSVRTTHAHARRTVSPVRKSIAGGAVRRLFRLHFA
jgi:hypothetical protein